MRTQTRPPPGGEGGALLTSSLSFLYSPPLSSLSWSSSSRASTPSQKTKVWLKRVRLLAWIRGLDTNLEVRPVGGHAGPVGVPPPAEVLLLVDGRQRVAQLLVNGPHAKGTDPEGTTELLSRCSSSYPRGRDALEETRRQTALNRLKVHRAIDFSVVSCEHGQSDRAETINLRENPSRLFRPGAPFPAKGAESMEELTSRCW